MDKIFSYTTCYINFVLLSKLIWNVLSHNYQFKIYTLRLWFYTVTQISVLMTHRIFPALTLYESLPMYEPKTSKTKQRWKPAHSLLKRSSQWTATLIAHHCLCWLLKLAVSAVSPGWRFQAISLCPEAQVQKEKKPSWLSHGTWEKKKKRTKRRS